MSEKTITVGEPTCTAQNSDSGEITDGTLIPLDVFEFNQEADNNADVGSHRKNAKRKASRKNARAARKKNRKKRH